MIFSFLTTPTFLTRTIIHVLLIYTPVSFINQYTQLVDFSVSTRVVNSLVSTLYYTWTNFWVIYLSILLYIIYNLLLKRTRWFNLNTLILLLLTATLGIIVDLTQLISLGYSLVDNELNFNELLQNKLNSYHPLLLYSAGFILFTPLNNFYNSRILGGTITIILSIMSGGWWAYQEGSWGGWWDWDASELLSIFILVSLLTWLHIPQNIHSCLYNSNLYLFLSTTVLFNYLVLQAGFAVTLHNFGTIDNDSFINVNYYIVLVPIVILTILYTTSLNFIVNRSILLLTYVTSSTLLTSITDSLTNYLVFALALHIISLSLVMLFSIGLQSIVLIYLQNLTLHSFHDLGTFWLYLFTITHLNLSTLSFIFITWITSDPLPSSIFLLLPLVINRHYYYHWSILVFLFLSSTFLLVVEGLSWPLNHTTVSYTLLPTSVHTEHKVNTLNCGYVTEVIFSTLQHSSTLASSRTLSLLTESDHLHNHNHLATADVFIQYWFSFERRSNTFKLVIEYGVTSLMWLSLSVPVLLSTLLHKNVKINF